MSSLMASKATRVGGRNLFRLGCRGGSDVGAGRAAELLAGVRVRIACDGGIAVRRESFAQVYLREL